MIGKFRDALRRAAPRFLAGMLGVWCCGGPFVVLKVSQSATWELTALLGLLLLVCYGIVALLCLRARWDALKELVAETRLALCFMIAGLLLNEMTGFFMAIKHRLVLLYAFVGFLIAELVNRNGNSGMLKRSNPTQRDRQANLATGAERFGKNSLEKQASQSETPPTENCTGSTRRAQTQARFDNDASAQGRSAIVAANGEDVFPDKYFLRDELDCYRSRLSANEIQLRELTRRSQEICERHDCVEAEVADLKDRLSDMQSKNREIEKLLDFVPDVGVEKVWFGDKLQRLEARIVCLERQMADGAMQLRELDDTWERLHQSERVLRGVMEENGRLSKLVSAWQERLAAREDSERRVDSLWRQIQEILAAYPAGVDSKGRAQEQIAGAVHSVPRVRDETETAVQLPGQYARQDDVIASNFQRGDAAESTHFQAHTKSNRAVWFPVKLHWRFGAVAALAFVIMTANTIGFRETTLPEPMALSQVPVSMAQVGNFKLASNPARKPTPRRRGVFETVRPTQVYTGPSENSALIADIGAGIKLNVVDSVYGWLEIRSKHGRPPGFVRQDATVQIALN